MPIRTATPTAVSAVDPRLANTLWQWLGLGLLAVVLLPAARGHSALIGYLPFWLVLAPASALLAVHRDALAAAWRAHLVRATPRRRRRSFRGQAAPGPVARGSRRGGTVGQARRVLATVGAGAAITTTIALAAAM